MTKTIVNGITELAAIGGVVFLSYTALQHGINGLLLAGALACITGVAGYEAKNIIDKLRKK